MTLSIPFDAVLFDCDGVLVDSEPITNGVLRDMLEERGWVLTPDMLMPMVALPPRLSAAFSLSPNVAA